MILIDYKDRRPIYEQIVEKIENLIAQGVLKEDSQLPSVRQMAVELSINPNTIQRAYGELERRKSTYSVKGKGSFISGNQALLSTKKQTILNGLKELIDQAWMIHMDKNEVIAYINGYYEQLGGDKK